MTTFSLSHLNCRYYVLFIDIACSIDLSAPRGYIIVRGEQFFF